MTSDIDMNLNPTCALAKDIILREAGGELLGLKDLSHGWSGSSVHVADVAGSKLGTRLIVKIASPDAEPAFADVPESNRVYGVCFSNLECVHQVMLENEIKLPKLHATGKMAGISYAVMEYLEGDTTFPDEMAGSEMGRINRITRSYQGWANMKQPYVKSWKDTFFTVMRSQLEEAAGASAGVRAIASQIGGFLDEKESNWRDPSQFVLSHLDGFQGMASQSDGAYIFSGVIDLEDHGFTDQRFVLAGHELMTEFWRHRKVSDAFWINYKKQTGIEETYAAYKPLFQLFYLLNWVPAFYARIQDPSMKDNVTAVEKLIGILTRSE